MATDTQPEVQYTNHALLDGLGKFGQQIGLFHPPSRPAAPCKACISCSMLTDDLGTGYDVALPLNKAN